MSRSPFGPIVEPPFDPDEDNRRVLAVAALVARAGGKAFEVGYLHEDAPTVEEAGWWVVAEWRGVKLSSGSEHRSSGQAADALADRLLNGAQCKCGRIASTNPAGVRGGDATTLLGEDWTFEQQKEAGVCVWRREGDRWKSGCDAPPRPLTPDEVKRLRG